MPLATVLRYSHPGSPATLAMPLAQLAAGRLTFLTQSLDAIQLSLYFICHLISVPDASL